MFKKAVLGALAVLATLIMLMEPAGAAARWREVCREMGGTPVSGRPDGMCFDGDGGVIF